MDVSGKNETCLNYSRNRRRGDKGEWWRGWIQLSYIIRTFINVTIYLQYNNKKINSRENLAKLSYSLVLGKMSMDGVLVGGCLLPQPGIWYLPGGIGEGFPRPDFSVLVPSVFQSLLILTLA
jgi:hypothetical protein